MHRREDFPIRISYSLFEKLKNPIFDLTDLALERMKISKLIQDQMIYCSDIENDKIYQIRKRLREVEDLMPATIYNPQPPTLINAHCDELRASATLFSMERNKFAHSRRQRIVRFLRHMIGCCCCGR